MLLYKKVKALVKNNLSDRQYHICVSILIWLRNVRVKLMYPYAKYFKTEIKLKCNKKNSIRKLEIGPGLERIEGFETLNIMWSENVDYIMDASKKLKFESQTFDLVYASHILEHMPWYQLDVVLSEWVRIIKKGGAIEIWVPNGLLISKAFVNAEEASSNEFLNDDWYKYNSHKDPCVWANGRVFSYGDGTGKKNHPNWHLSLFSPRYLEKLLLDAGLKNIEILSATEVRGHDHGWINLGMRGIKS